MNTPRLTRQRARFLFPYLSDIGLRAATQPDRYVVHYMDNVQFKHDAVARGFVNADGDVTDEAYDELDYWSGYGTAIEGGQTLVTARNRASALLIKDPLCLPVVWERVGLQRDDLVYDGLILPAWTYDEEWVEEIGE